MTFSCKPSKAHWRRVSPDGSFAIGYALAQRPSPAELEARGVVICKGQTTGAVSARVVAAAQSLEKSVAKDALNQHLGKVRTRAAPMPTLARR